jgi:RNA binding exosome subunit
MKIAHSIKITVFVKEEEDESKVKAKLLSLFPFDLEKEKLGLKESTATGFDDKKIKIFEILLEKDKHIEMFLNKLLEDLSDSTKEFILRGAEKRLDKDCNFFLRFSKEKLIEENDLWLTNQGNCFHIKINIAAFPKKQENAMEIIRNLFKLEG